MLEQEIEQNFQQQIANVKHDDPFRSAKTISIKNHNKEDLDKLESLKKNERKSKKWKLTRDVEAKLGDSFKNKKLKTLIDFDKNECNIIKSKAVKGSTIVDVTWRFIKWKMLMFAKISFKSFLYKLVNFFLFMTEEVRKIYDQLDIIKCHMYLNLTNTDSCLCFFNFVCKKECNIKEIESRKLIFEVLKRSKIVERLDVSDKFW